MSRRPGFQSEHHGTGLLGATPRAVRGQRRQAVKSFHRGGGVTNTPRISAAVGHESGKEEMHL
jgi:hypothetical protein